MRDKILVLTTILVASLMLSITIAPALAFVYPDGSQDNEFEIYGPHIDKILVKKYASLDAEMNALQGGEIDITDWPLTKTWVDTLTADPNVAVVGYGGEAGYYTFNFNHNNNPYLGNPEDPAYTNPVYPNPTSVVSFRQALSHLIDRVALCSLEGEGLFDPIFTPIPSYMVYWIHPEIKYGGALEAIAYPYSISDAAAKLTADGFLMGGPGGKRYWDMNGNAAYDAGEEVNLLLYTRADKLRKGAADRLVAGLDDPAIQVGYTRFEVTGGQAWQTVMVEKNYNMYTSGWIYIGPDPDYLFDLYNWDNYYHPEDPPNFGAIGKYDALLNQYSSGIKYATSTGAALANALDFQIQFASTACEIPLGSTAAPKAYSKTYTGGNDGAMIGDEEDKYRGLPWTDIVNEKGIGENSWYTTLNAYPYVDPVANPDPLAWRDFGDGNMIMRYGWEQVDMPQTLNPMYSSWYWESEIYGRVYDGMGGRNPMTKGPVQVPAMADNWTVGTWVDPRDGITKAAITVSMRPDVVWSDGIPVTVEDVIYTFIQMPAALRAKGCPDVWWQPTIDQIAGFYKLDQYTVQVLMTVNAVWAMNWIVGNIVVPKHIWEPLIATRTVAEISGDFSAEPAVLVGTGPFLYIENTPNTVLMVRNPTYYNYWDKCINMYDGDNAKGIQVIAITPSANLSPFKIKEDGTGIGHAIIWVWVKNLDERHWEDFSKLVELVYPDGHTEVLANVTDVVLDPSAYYFELFTKNALPKGHYQIKVTLTITSGHNYEFWAARGGSPHFLGPKTIVKDFWVTVQADLNGDGTVDIFDIVPIAVAFGSQIGDLNYSPTADLNHDGKVDIFDIVIVAINFGWSY